MLVCAFQARQAAAFGGTIIHSIANIPDERTNQVTTRLSCSKKAFWKGVTILLIAEISMVSVKMLAALHVAGVTALGTDSELLFGGLDVIALGDFSQLVPVASKGLATGFTAELGAGILATASTAAFGGQHLFLSMTAWVMLTETKRFSGSLGGIVERPREGKCTEDDWIAVNRRVVGGPEVQGSDCQLSAMIVLRNKIRCALAVPFARSACARKNIVTSSVDRSIDCVWPTLIFTSKRMGLQG